jgi:hypothetical protein
VEDRGVLFLEFLRFRIPLANEMSITFALLYKKDIKNQTVKFGFLVMFLLVSGSPLLKERG